MGTYGWIPEKPAKGKARKAAKPEAAKPEAGADDEPAKGKAE